MRSYRIKCVLYFVACMAVATAAFGEERNEQDPAGLIVHGNTARLMTTAAEPSSDRHSKPQSCVDGAVLQPIRSATISAEISGVLDKFHAAEGDRVTAGQVVAEISPRRYVVNATRARMRVKSLETAVKTARKNCEAKGKILAEGAGTEQEVLNADAALEGREAELSEARQLLKLALIDLDACKIKAPFDGFIEQRFKSCFEAVEKSDKLFEIVDASSVYAVANVPAAIQHFFEQERRCLFVIASGKTFIGSVQKCGVKIDPKSNTRKVFVLIPNDEAALQIGMTGELRLAK